MDWMKEYAATLVAEYSGNIPNGIKASLEVALTMSTLLLFMISSKKNSVA